MDRRGRLYGAEHRERLCADGIRVRIGSCKLSYKKEVEIVHVGGCRAPGGWSDTRRIHKQREISPDKSL
jgi:hypothetical protein